VVVEEELEILDEPALELHDGTPVDEVADLDQ
jgi:hypothetical protein